MNKELLSCPLTKLLFCDPVVAEDQNTYEFMALRDWLSANKTSPVTGSPMGTTVIRNTLIKKIVDEFIKANPEEKKNQFLYRKPFYLFEREFIELLKTKQYTDITTYTHFQLNYDLNSTETLFEYLCKSAPNDVIKHVIDNSIDFDVESGCGQRPIHIACRFSNADIIKYLVDKNVDIECDNFTGIKPINYLVTNHGTEYELIKYFLDKNIKLNFEIKSGYNLLYYVISYGNLELLKLLQNAGMDLNAQSSKCAYTPMQYSFKCAKDLNLIKYLIDVGINIDVDTDPKTSNEQIIYTNDSLQKKEKQQAVLYYLNKTLNKAIVVDNFLDNKN